MTIFYISGKFVNYYSQDNFFMDHFYKTKKGRLGIEDKHTGLNCI